jgi:dTDP-4-amino-4,6-dideoxygalactose transaminase
MAAAIRSNPNQEWPGDAERVPLIQPELPELADIAADIDQALKSGRVTNFGPFVSNFEAEVAKYLGAGAVTVSSGTMGLLFALQALGVPPGSRVAIPSFTFTATGQAVLYAGCIPVFVDVQDDLTISPDDLADVLDRYADVSAVIPVHTFGLPAAVEKIDEVVDAMGSRPKVIYDAAHGFGSAIGGRRVGTFGDAEVFSLSATKVLISIEGGIITSHDEDLLGRLRQLRNYGIEANYDAWYPGLNGKMSELHAIVGLHSLERLDEQLALRKAAADYYRNVVAAATDFELIPVPGGIAHTFKDFAVVMPAVWRGRQHLLTEFLAEQGIESRRYFYPPLHRQRYFSSFVDGPLPNTDHLADRILCLPFFSAISERQMDRVVEALSQAEEALL